MIDIYRYSKRGGEGAIQREKVKSEELKRLKEREKEDYMRETHKRGREDPSESPFHKIVVCFFGRIFRIK